MVGDRATPSPCMYLCTCVTYEHSARVRVHPTHSAAIHSTALLGFRSVFRRPRSHRVTCMCRLYCVQCTYVRTYVCGHQQHREAAQTKAAQRAQVQANLRKEKQMKVRTCSTVCCVVCNEYGKHRIFSCLTTGQHSGAARFFFGPYVWCLCHALISMLGSM